MSEVPTSEGKTERQGKGLGALGQSPEAKNEPPWAQADNEPW